MIRNSIDVSIRVSPQLSALLNARARDPDAEQPVTLEAARHFLTELLPVDFSETERLHHFDISESMLDELDTLIEEFGEDALAADFAQAQASEPLSRALEAVVNDDNREPRPTLSDVRDALTSGLSARLVGDGVLEDDEDDTLLAEVDGLIAQFGAEAPAEEFLRYE